MAGTHGWNAWVEHMGGFMAWHLLMAARDRNTW